MAADIGVVMIFVVRAQRDNKNKSNNNLITVLIIFVLRAQRDKRNNNNSVNKNRASNNDICVRSTKG